MPELPEVETIKRQLASVLVGQEIVAVEVRHPKSFYGNAKQIVGKRIMGVDRRAKILIIELGDWFLLVHLKMTGQLVYQGQKRRIVGGPARKRYALRVAGGHPTADWVAQLPNNHTRVILQLTKGTLYFNDQRIFGWMKLVDRSALEKEFKNYGPDITDEKVTQEYFYRILQKSRRAVKLVITDQKDVAGVGNIYANDGLWCAKINPRKPANQIIRKEADKLLKCLREVLDEGIKYGGATASDDKFVQTSGLGGKYQEHFKVYEQVGKKCLRCGSIIRKITLGGRGTYFCEQCQL